MSKDKKQEPAKKNPDGKKRDPVMLTVKSVYHFLQNKVIAALLLLGQGVLFLVSPSGDMKDTIRISAGLVIAAALVLIFLHLRHREKSALDIVISVFAGLLIPAGIFCLVSPQTVEPFVRFAVGIVTIVTGILSLIETLKIKKKKDWKFIVSVAGAVAITGLGIVMIAAQVEDIAVTQRIIGTFLILNAVARIWCMIQLRHALRQEKAGSPADGTRPSDPAKQQRPEK